MRESETDRPTLRWRPRAFLLLASGTGLIVAALLLRSPVPLFLALPLLLALPAAALGGPSGPVPVTIERTISGTSDEVDLSVRVVPQDGSDARDLEVEIERPPGLLPRGPDAVTETSSEVRLEARWRAPEPTVALVGAPEVVWRDAAGLVERPARFDAPPLPVERYPPELVRIGRVRLRRTTLLPGETPSARVGPVGDFFGLQEAPPGTPAVRINWRASARTGRWITNEYQLDRTGDLLLFLDARRTSLGPAADERLLGISRAAALGAAESFLREKARVGLAVFSEFVAAVRLASGRAQLLRLREALLAARLGPEQVPSERGAVSLGRYFAPGVTTLLFTPLADDASRELVVHLRRRGFPVVVLSPSPLPLYARSARLPEDTESLVARIDRLARRSTIAQSWQEAPTVDWEQYWSLGALVELLRRPATRRVG